MKSSLAEQKKLLELQSIDTGLARLAHRRSNLPENAEIASVTAERGTLRTRLAAEIGALEDAKTELSRLESDAEVVEARIARDSERVAHSSSVKDVAALESELESLRRRKSVLEDMELTVMQNVEDAESVVSATRSEDDAFTARLDQLTAARTASLDAVEQEAGELAANRGLLEETTDAELLALYENRRAKGGTGAALFRAGTCGGCTMTLTGNDLASIRAAEIDDVIHCPECGCILVRTEESGLW